LHLICECPELAAFYRAYLLNDYTAAQAAAESVGAEAAMAAAAAAPVAVDVFAGVMARKPKQFFDTKIIARQVTVRPLLTPDAEGYRAPILELIRGAKKRLYMQTQSLLSGVFRTNRVEVPEE
jgi:hypothetical protein